MAVSAAGGTLEVVTITIPHAGVNSAAEDHRNRFTGADVGSEQSETSARRGALRSWSAPHVTARAVLIALA
jgi:hypothetical protein